MQFELLLGVTQARIDVLADQGAVAAVDDFVEFEQALCLRTEIAAVRLSRQLDPDQFAQHAAFFGIQPGLAELFGRGLEGRFGAGEILLVARDLAQHFAAERAQLRMTELVGEREHALGAGALGRDVTLVTGDAREFEVEFGAELRILDRRRDRDREAQRFACLVDAAESGFGATAVAQQAGAHQRFRYITECR